MRRSPLRVLVAALVAATATAAPVPVPVPASAAPVDDPAIIEGEMLVRFEPGIDGSERAEVRSQHGLDEVRDLPIDGVELVRFDADEDPGAKGRRLRDDRRIRWAEPNRRWTAADVAPPNDTRFDEQWALHNTGQDGGTPGADIGALDARPLAADTAEVVVAVIDTGIDISHPDLESQIWVNEADNDGDGVDDDGNGQVDDVHGWDFVGNDATVYDADDDDHGTHVAGTIAATTGNGTGVAGVSNARIMPLKFLGPDGTGSTDGAVAALDYAIRMGADIVNASWSGPESQALAAKIAQAQAAGVWVVAAAGNGGEDEIADDIDATPAYPASFPHDNVVSVAATDRNDDLAAFSNHGGTSVDLGAPGDSILSLLPDDSILSPLLSGEEYGTKSGTSMAAPHVSGALAHVVAAYPELSMADAKQLLLDRAEPVPALEGKTVSGGRLDLARLLGAGIDPPQLTIGDAQVVEGDAGAGGQLELPLTLNAPHNGPVVVDWATGAANDTATADVDYVPVGPGQTTIAAGATTATVTVDVLGDDLDEPDETFSVVVQGATDATVADAAGRATIADDDEPPPPPATGGGGGGGAPAGGGATPTGGTEPPAEEDGTEPPTEDDGTEPPTEPEAPLPAGAHRLAGSDRTDTAVQVSRASWDDGEAGSVVLARGDDYPDALAGGALAVGVDAPLLLTSGSELPAAVAAEVRRVLPAGGTVRLLGGPAAIDGAVEDALDAMGYVVERVSGRDRYVTATAIAEEGTPAPEAILVTTGTGFADALAASAAAGHLGGVVVLTDGPRLPAATAAYLDRHAGVPVHAVGGPAAAALGNRATSSIAGADRYATAVAVADRWFADAEVVGIATGVSFPDALAAGARLGRIGAPLVLSPPTSVPDGVGATISRAARVELYGGEAALSEAVESVLRRLLG